jgi:CRISPR/Cas system CSM-associated protein Csm3 (group 7 of RAMP superfamily)
MHKRYVNHCTLCLTLKPDGPVLIKAGKQGADPTKPDMEFVETYRGGGRTVYFPGSSLKGAIRAHAERIVRTVGGDRRPEGNKLQLWASDPLDQKANQWLEKIAEPHQVYALSSFTDQMFGNTAIASRLRIEDAYPKPGTPLRLEERNGVAIDRVFGSVAVGLGPFSYQVCVEGSFQTKIHLKNFTLAQLGLLGLVLRDLDEGWFGIGFAKSRGMGRVRVEYEWATVDYPGCLVEEGSQELRLLGSQLAWPRGSLLGAGEFLTPEEAGKYGFPKPDCQAVPVGAEPMPLGFGARLTWDQTSEAKVEHLLAAAVKSWAQLLQTETKAV